MLWEPEQTSQQIESSNQIGDESTKKLIIHLENEVKKYQEREERLMQQIDRMQTLIELKTVAPATAAPQQDATACDTDMPQHATTQQDNDNKKNNELNIVENVAVPQQETTYHTQTLQHATLQNVAVPQPKTWLIWPCAECCF
jgi:type IV secretory pathway VirJ component